MRSFVVLGCLGCLIVSPAQADPKDELGAAATFELDGGTGNRHGLDLATIGLGIAARPSTMLTIQALGFAIIPHGITDEGIRANSGMGGELVFVLTPLPRGPVRPYLRWATGMSLFLRAPFLPGGDFYEFMFHAAAGIDVPISDRVVLSVHADYSHLSNGQGLGTANPSFDGVGGGLDLGIAFATPRETDPDLTTPSPSQPALVADGVFGGYAGALFGSGRVRGALPISSQVRVQADLEVGDLGGDPFAELGVATITDQGPATLAIHGGFREYAGIHTGIVQLQSELAVTPATALEATAIWEPSSYISSARGGFGLRVRPLRSVRIDAGFGVTSGDRGIAPYFTGEWRLPRTPLGVFYERQIDGLNELGVRLALGGELWRRLR